MKVYIAHNFEARDWLRENVLPLLKKIGHTSTSDWITDDSHLKRDMMKESAIADAMGIDTSDMILFFAKQLGDRPGRGKYFELGYAYARHKGVMVVGNEMELKECVFYHMPGVMLFNGIESAMQYLSGKREVAYNGR